MPDPKTLFNGQKKKGGKFGRLKDREVVDREISAHDYPSLGLGDKEYVIVDIERSKAGLIFIWASVVSISILMMVFCQMMIWTVERFEAAFLMVMLGYILVFVAIALGTIESRIYRKNYMIVTNQRAFTQTQIGPLATKTQVIELENIEDVGVYRGGVLPMLFGYGEIRLSTERDESAYKITFAKNPDEQAAEIKRKINEIRPNPM